MGADGDDGTLALEELNGGDRRADTGVIRDGLSVKGDVHVATDEDLLALELGLGEVLNGLLGLKLKVESTGRGADSEGGCVVSNKRIDERAAVAGREWRSSGRVRREDSGIVFEGEGREREGKRQRYQQWTWKVTEDIHREALDRLRCMVWSAPEMMTIIMIAMTTTLTTPTATTADKDTTADDTHAHMHTIQLGHGPVRRPVNRLYLSALSHWQCKDSPGVKAAALLAVATRARTVAAKNFMLIWLIEQKGGLNDLCERKMGKGRRGQKSTSTPGPEATRAAGLLATATRMRTFVVRGGGGRETAQREKGFAALMGGFECVVISAKIVAQSMHNVTSYLQSKAVTKHNRQRGMDNQTLRIRGQLGRIPMHFHETIQWYYIMTNLLSDRPTVHPSVFLTYVIGVASVSVGLGSMVPRWLLLLVFPFCWRCCHGCLCRRRRLWCHCGDCIVTRSGSNQRPTRRRDVIGIFAITRSNDRLTDRLLDRSIVGPADVGTANHADNKKKRVKHTHEYERNKAVKHNVAPSTCCVCHVASLFRYSLDPSIHPSINLSIHHDKMRFSSFFGLLLAASIHGSVTASKANGVARPPSAFKRPASKKKHAQMTAVPTPAPVSAPVMISKPKSITSGMTTHQQALVGSASLWIMDTIFRKAFRANKITFPASLGGCIALFFALLGIDAVKSGSGDVIYKFLEPGSLFLAKWLPVFFVPGLAMLPLAPSVGSSMDVRVVQS